MTLEIRKDAEAGMFEVFNPKTGEVMTREQLASEAHAWVEMFSRRPSFRPCAACGKPAPDNSAHTDDMLFCGECEAINHG